MEALILTVFVSIVLSALAVAMFVWDVRQGGHDHHDRLSLLPLDSNLSLGDQQVAPPHPSTMGTDKGNEA